MFNPFVVLVMFMFMERPHLHDCGVICVDCRLTLSPYLRVTVGYPSPSARRAASRSSASRASSGRWPKNP
eukprot:4354581-Prymnesium_polylepis.1